MNIIANGQQYSDWASLPPDVKQKLAQSLPDLNHNGVPDLLEQPTGAVGAGTVSSVMVNVDGQTYTSAAQMPPELQDMLRQALGSLSGLVGNAAPPPAPATGTQMPPGQVLLNGVPTPVDAEPPKKKHWWQRG
jgi:hypothetical protein